MIRFFTVSRSSLKQLTPNERKILKILNQAVVEFAKVCEIQLVDGFYPKNISKYQLEIAAAGDKDILSPFSHVYKSHGVLKAIPYHIKYAELLKPISKKISQAAKLSKNPSFKKYLNKRAQSLLDGSYREADIAWINVKHSKIDFAIGPFERYLDKILFVKRSYQAHTGVIDQEATIKAERMKEVLYQTAKLTPHDINHSTEIPKKGVQILVEETPVTTGYMSDALFSGEHFPCDLDLIEEYGAKIIIYKSQLDLKFEKLHYPIFKAIFEKKFASKYSKSLLLKATSYHSIWYELGRQLHKFKGSRERLKELYGIIDEANGGVSAIAHSKYLLVKGYITQEELEAVIIIQICWMLSDWSAYQTNKGMENYIRADAMVLTYFLVNGALSIQDGISWPNFPKIFFETEQLANLLSATLQYSGYYEAEKLINLMAKLQNVKKLSRNVENVSLAI